jgi:hypothetical protein
MGLQVKNVNYLAIGSLSRVLSRGSLPPLDTGQGTVFSASHFFALALLRSVPQAGSQLGFAVIALRCHLWSLSHHVTRSFANYFTGSYLRL